jgi:hypothetical protein
MLLAFIRLPSALAVCRLRRFQLHAAVPRDYGRSHLAGSAASTLPAAKFEPAGEGTPAGGTSSEKTREATGDTLAAYLKAKGGENKQVQRFLATAGWLYRRNEKELSPTAVAKALSRNHQKGLANAADCLNQNVGKGYCEKTEGNKFFITHDGWKQLGEQE